MAEEDKVKAATDKALDSVADDAMVGVDDLMPSVAEKILEATNILVALSGDPSVDEMAAAIGLSIYLDKMGKRTTAIYSGATPNALQFLKPEETFAERADTLQDFVIALNKEKADHLRYKIDGDFVKIYITPYGTRISEDDLDFSYGDFNVDLVLALDVANGIDLDAALREHGRIMHDAVIVNITTGKPGKFGEIEWSDTRASSVSEMLAKLLYTLAGKIAIEKEEATALLTGIVAATNRFSNAKTTPETMKISSKLMESGANQQLISRNITADVDNELLMLNTVADEIKAEDDATKLSIAHEGDGDVDEAKKVDVDVDTDAATVTGGAAEANAEATTLLEDLKAAEASLAGAGAEAVPENINQPVNLTEPTEPAENAPIPEPVMPEVVTPEPVAEEPLEAGPVMAQEPVEAGILDKPEKVIQPNPGMDLSALDAAEEANKYSRMFEEALESGNPAAFSAPSVPMEPEINGVPDMNFMPPMPNDNVLPPPPAPDFATGMPPAMPAMPPMSPEIQTTSSAPVMPDVTPIQAAVPAPTPTLQSLGSQPSMQDQVYGAQANDPGAFKIPGF